MSFGSTFDAVERLSSRIIAGEAVFFVGAGFSLDSEPNTSARLIRRLIARFAAITEQLAAEPASEAVRLRKGLRVTFDLGEESLSSEEMVSDKIVKQLKQVYYNINDWICSAFAILLRELQSSKASVLDGIHERENRLLATVVDGKPYDDVPLENFDVPQLLALGPDAGKGLFLETMGFASGRIWGGNPLTIDPREALDSYGGRLRDRQYVIARLAREGLAPLILTTNFDLLLEGVCRGAGFEVGDARRTDPAKPAAAYDRLLVIAGPTDFFERGTAYRTALLLKIHGCVYRYREERQSPSALARYLPSMVFTYREIQNWRKDSWSRDLVSTLLRTRSIVLCGYSGADPVVHDTFRTVYEEILAHRSTPPPGDVSAGGPPAGDTRAFFTGAAGKGEFAGLEILRAGSRAAGVADPPLFGHPNYLPFHFNVEPGTRQLFPTLDELFLWIYHRSLRLLQLNAIRSDLGRIAVMLLHRNVAPADIEEIASMFEDQCRRENELARQWDDTERSRGEFLEVTAWTNYFHVALLREFALMETVARNQRSGLRIQEFRSRTYYFALLDRPGWGAWGAVVELALRKMAAVGEGRSASIAPCSYPVALVTSRPAEFTRTAIVLRGPGTDRIARADLPGLYRRIHEWQVMTWAMGEALRRELLPPPISGGGRCSPRSNSKRSRPVFGLENRMSLRTRICLKLLAALKAPPFELKWQSRRNLAFDSSASAAERLTLRNARVCAAPKIRVAGELDLSPDLLILDHGLGVIGLVHIVQRSASEPLAEQAKRHVDQATYLRHLLVTRGVAAGTPAFRLDFTVECVLVIPKDLAHEMIDVVREIASKTRFLHATGLNLLPFSTPFQFEPAELQRAFAWLLPSARRRLSSCTAPTSRLQALELFNYRLPGLRPWTLSGNRVHLLHGPNGTGKSSIAEALELVVTGSVERIKTNPHADYAGIIRNSESPESPTISVSLSDSRRLPFTVTATGVSQAPLRPDLPVTAFRLDQTVMDQLIRADSQQRARILTKSFFPGEAYQTLELAQQEFNQAFRELPSELSREIETLEPDANKRNAAVVRRLEWVEAPTIPIERIADCLPLKRESLESLAGIVPEIADILKSLETQPDKSRFETNLQQLDEALGRVRSNVRRYRDAVVQSLAVLKRVSAWAPIPGEVWLEYPDLLLRWSDRVALSDVLKKHLDISRTLLDARAAGWAPANPAGLLSVSLDSLQGSIAGLIKAAEQCTLEQDEFFKQLGKTGDVTPAGEERQSPSLSTPEIGDLNLTGGWFARQLPTPPSGQFGDTVQDAISGNTSKSFGSITIPSQGWTDGPANFLAPLQTALDELLAFEPTSTQPSPAGPSGGTSESPVYRSPVVRLHAYRKALATARKVASANQKVEEALMNRLREHKLNEALDEVIALFTPARWAYEGLLVDPKLSDGKVAVELVTSKTQSQAEMRLNTAELNLVVLALYLLCSPTIDNPLGTVILDDPLQNMDELTAATVARGVSKIAALLPEGWQLIMMFHGDEDLETFRREVPGSVYFLPWLGPIGAVDTQGNGILAEARGRPAVESRKLSEVVQLVPKRRPSSGTRRGSPAEPGSP